jgi:hypothetical protein
MLQSAVGFDITPRHKKNSEVLAGKLHARTILHVHQRWQSISLERRVVLTLLCHPEKAASNTHSSNINPHIKHAQFLFIKEPMLRHRFVLEHSVPINTWALTFESHWGIRCDTRRLHQTMHSKMYLTHQLHPCVCVRLVSM